MSVVNASGDEKRADAPRGRTAREDTGTEHQAAWFEIGTDAAASQDDWFVGVVFNRPLDQVFTYRAPRSLGRIIQPGQRVRVPLGRGDRLTTGYCVSVDSRLPEGLEPARIKEVIEVLDPLPLIDKKMLELARWIGDYYACTWGQALHAAVPAGVKKHSGTRIGRFLIVPEETRESLRAQSLEPPLTSKQTAVLDVLCQTDKLLTTADVCRLARCTAVPVQALLKRGLLHTVKRRFRRIPAGSDSSGDRVDAPLEGAGIIATDGGGSGAAEARSAAARAPALTGEQVQVLERVVQAVQAGGFAPFLIHGVTGSGKTEVYLSAIEHVVARGREAIVLVPEISLTPQTIRRFRRRFDKVAVLHSHLSDAERHYHWQSIVSGEVQVVVGARSAIFAPARRLGLIVVDEEHESTFKQETTPRYHARDVAVKRAQMEGIPVLLGSATPSLESWRNAERGRYVRLVMPNRVGGRPLPDVEILDLRNEKLPVGGLSEPLRQAMHAALDQGGQVILLLNRRGFNTFVICPQCGQVVKCQACDVTATYHKSRHVLLCHTCDAERPCPVTCPHCQTGRLHYGGIGTERLEREIQTAFPHVVSRRMDSDTMRSPGSHEKVLTAFKNGQVQILLGTQMIAKGLDFPNVTLVGVVSADTALHLPDFRAAERTFQLLAQVAGRTGRGDRPGRVLVQTYSPDHAAIRAAARHDYLEFVHGEMPERERFGVPPFGRMVRVIARGRNESEVSNYLEEVAAGFRAAADPAVVILGPAPAPILKIRNLYRYHFQLRCPISRPLQTLTSSVPPRHPPPHGIELAIDVDPITML